ncbi:hypothetical protein AVEN_239352-1 [Araneus ventricosus]|uniref:RNA-directed DNA polymerase n=1 Tax=Araneus ventricosus TaxID=182803 RepID=A0A4Y2EB98_ARAVE|nr:hypothetical protein AVEN_239352-1 [Araneus ventricosus]
MNENKQNISLYISGCKQINSHCSQTTEDQVNLPQSVTENKCELRREVKEIIKNFDSVFSKDKYDVGALRIEPQRIVPNSDLPVSLRPYRTSPVEEQEIKSQVEKLFQAGLIKESNSLYSSPVTVAFKRDEGKKTRLCIDFKKLSDQCKSDFEPLPLMDGQRFLGSVNVYNKFIPQYAKLRFPLNQLLKKDVKFNWTNECQDTFDKETLTTKPVLHLYNPDVTCHALVDV